MLIICLKTYKVLIFIAVENVWWWFHAINREPCCFNEISMTSTMTLYYTKYITHFIIITNNNISLFFLLLLY